jgi:hypothetical protein
MALHALNLLTHSRLIADIELHQSQCELIVLPTPCPHAVAPIDFGHASELIERSAEGARAFLDDREHHPPIARRRPARHPRVRNHPRASQRDRATA